MIHDKDSDVLKLLNKELKKYKVKLAFRYYDICPFDNNKMEIMEIILKHTELLESYHNKISILSSLCDETFKNSVPYLIDTYFYFIENVYSVPLDEAYLLNLCDTIAKINSPGYPDLYKKFLCGSLTQSAESMIKMLAEYNLNEYDDIIFSLVKKENLIPEAWIGVLNEDSKYWCSLIALKCIVRKKDKKYLSFFEELLVDENMQWVKFSDSKYKESLTLEWKNKYKKLAQKGIEKIKNCN